MLPKRVPALWWIIIYINVIVCRYQCCLERRVLLRPVLKHQFQNWTLTLLFISQQRTLCLTLASYVDDGSLPGSWYPIENRNNNLHFRVTGQNSVELPEHSYDIASLHAEIVTAMSTADNDTLSLQIRELAHINFNVCFKLHWRCKF